KPDPHAHLVLLAHWARLAQSRTFLDGLRRARTPDEVMALVCAAELRHAPVPAETKPVASHDLIVISVSGEKVVDALLIGLVDDGYEDACVIEAQSLREAATREVPLFAGFRDLFGDPGGRRVLLVDVEASRTDAVMRDRKSTRLNSSHVKNSYAVFCLKKKRIPVQNYLALHHTYQHSSVPALHSKTAPAL